MDVLHAYVLSVLDKRVRDEIAPRFWTLLVSRREQEQSERQSEELQTQGREGGRDEADRVLENEDDDDEEEGNDEGGGRGGEGSGQSDDPPSSRRRAAYGRVKRALLYVAQEVNGHLALVRLLDGANSPPPPPETVPDKNSGSSSSGGGDLRSSAGTTAPHQPSSMSLPRRSLETRYRCALTAQVMAGATGDFQDTMREFFDRNLRFWHHSWLNGRRRRRGGRLSGVRGKGEEGDGMDVSDDERRERKGEEEEEQDEEEEEENRAPEVGSYGGQGLAINS